MLQAAILVAGFSSAAHSALITWNAAGGGDFNTAGNWDPATVPVTGDVAIFANNITGNVTLASPANPLDISLRNTSGAIMFDLGGSTLTLGGAGTGTLAGGRMLLGTAAGHVNDVTVTNGTLAHVNTGSGNFMVVGNFNGSNGNKLRITGAGTSVTSPSTANPILNIGVAGSNNNSFTVDNGASVVLRGTTGVGVIGATPSTGNSITVNNGTFSLTGGGRGINLRNGSLSLTKSYSDLGFLDAAIAGNNSTITFNSGELYSRRTQIDNSKNFVIGDGGSDPATFGLAYGTPTLTLGAVGRPADLVLSSNGILTGSGTGTITGGGTVRGSASAKVRPSTIGGPAVLTDDRPTGTINIAGAWDNTNLDVELDLGDFPAGAANLPTPFVAMDIINVTGAFTHGGVVTFNLTGLVLPAVPTEFKAIGWTSEIGSTASTVIQFTGGGPLPTRFAADGLYITVPEPGAALLGMAALPLLRRRRR